MERVHCSKRIVSRFPASDHSISKTRRSAQGSCKDLDAHIVKFLSTVTEVPSTKVGTIDANRAIGKVLVDEFPRVMLTNAFILTEVATAAFHAIFPAATSASRRR